MSKNISHLSSRQGLLNNLLKGQQAASLAADPISAKKRLAEKALIGIATLESSTSFYDFMDGDNAHKKAYVCNGSSCLCKGGQSLVKEQLAAIYGDENIGHITCLGQCYEGRSFQVDSKNYSGNDIDKLTDIATGKYNNDVLIPIGKSLGDSVLFVDETDLEKWYQPLLNGIANGQSKKFLDILLSASLRGRGGAGFPAGLKWQACAKQQSSKKYIVCNADEGDAGAFTDRYLLERQPHSVLFGMMMAGFITGADEGILYIRDEYPLGIKVIENAISELTELGFLGTKTGTNIHDSGFNFKFHIIRGSGAYICGEETALLRSIEGQRPVVSVRPPFPVESGLFGKPTVVNNVETFACIHWIIENSAGAFSDLGTEQSAGVKLLSLDHSFNLPGVYEVPMGTSLSVVINDLGGGFSQPLKALQIGGPLGGIIPVEKLEQLSVDFESFSKNGFLLGHGSIVGIPESMPMLDYLVHLFEFTANESCGKCFPCRLGATRGAEMLAAAKEGELIDRELLNDLLETMELGSLCALGGGLPLPIKNVLQWFETELSGSFKKESL